MNALGEVSQENGLQTAVRDALDSRFGDRVSYVEAIRSSTGIAKPILLLIFPMQLSLPRALKRSSMSYNCARHMMSNLPHSAEVFGYALTTVQVCLAHVIETRRAIEVQSAQLAARHADDRQRKVMRELVEQMRRALDEQSSAVAAR